MGCLHSKVIIRLMKNRIIFPFISMLIGITLAGMAVFADRIGLDPSSGWGKIRIALLIFGVFITICSALLWRYIDETRWWMRKILSSLENHPIAKNARSKNSVVYLSGLVKNYWFTLPILVLVILIYVWFVSSGTWVSWVSPTHFYADLTRGFLRGNLYLPIKENSNPLASPGPFTSGKGAQGPLDVSYFHGKYYLYWGPVPALLLLLIHPIIPWRVGDLQLVFGFVTGVYILQCVLAVVIWDRFFRNLPEYILWLSVLLVGLASPATFILNSYKSARIYEAAITGGQFFLVGGFTAAVVGLGSPICRWLLVLAGILWALAIGTRLILVLPIGFIVLMVAWWILNVNHWSLKGIRELIPLGLPLVLGLVVLGWYNWARFGSITETGFIYQIPSAMNLQRLYSDIIKPIYILQNLYNYFLNPVEIRSQFPYVFAEFGNTKAIFSSYALPNLYSAQPITGLLYLIPFIIFGIIPLTIFLYDLFSKKTFRPAPENDDRRVLNWTILSLSGGCLLVFGFLLSYYWAAARFVEDVEPFLAMLSVIGFWQGYQIVSNKPAWKRSYTSLGVILASASILISTLVAISVNDARFVIIRLFSSIR